MPKSTRNRHGPPNGGPSIIAPALWTSGENPGHPLTAEERSLLATIATVVRFNKGETIYKAGEAASAVFNIVTGVVKSYNDFPDQKEHVVGFLFNDDLLGLAENGKYVNSAAAVTAVTLFKIPARALEARMRKHPNLDFQIIAKLCHDLRQAQRHAFLLSKQRAIAKVGIFLQILETHQNERDQTGGEIYLPITQSDLASYAGISPEAVSRAFRDLVGRGAISVRDRRHIRVVDRAALEAAVAETDIIVKRLRSAVN